MIEDERSGMDDSDVALNAVWRSVWRLRIVAGVFAVFGGLIAAIVALNMTPIFHAEIVVTQVQDTGVGGASSLVDKLGGLASLAGINIGGAGAGPQAQAVLKSWRLAEEFVKQGEMLPDLSAGSDEPLSLWRGVQAFRKSILSVREDKRSGTTIIGINWTDPNIAAQWANGYVALANETLRLHAIEDSSRNVAYLNEQIAKTTVVELQRVMYGLVEAEMKTLMLANARAEYAFAVVDPAVPPEVRVSPRRSLITLFGVLLGALVGLLSGAFRLWLRERRSAAAVAVSTVNPING